MMTAMYMWIWVQVNLRKHWKVSAVVGVLLVLMVAGWFIGEVPCTDCVKIGGF